MLLAYNVIRFLSELGIQNPKHVTVFESLQKSDFQVREYSGYILGGLRISRPQEALSMIEDLKLTKDTHNC